MNLRGTNPKVNLKLVMVVVGILNWQISKLQIWKTQQGNLLHQHPCPCHSFVIFTTDLIQRIPLIQLQFSHYDEDVLKCHRIYKTPHNMVLKIRYATVRTIPLDLCVAQTNKNHHWEFIFVMGAFLKFLKLEKMVGHWEAHSHIHLLHPE